jgi:hypothetical protein
MSGPENGSGRGQLVAPIGIVGGVLLIVASFFVPEKTIARATWDAERAREYQQSALRLHELAHEAGHADEHGGAEKVERDLAEAKQAFEAVQMELDATTRRPRFLRQALRWAGVAAATLGVLGFFIVQRG